jgi:hypothetical protein
MSQLAVTIPKQPMLPAVADYYRLRRDGIGFIEKLGSRLWTDYNTHDPGITILEVLCYAITDLAYRIDWPIKDILTPAIPSAKPNQPFFTAREILTVNPWTTEDFRRLLIDLETVRNAWVFCKTCACDLHYFSWCDKDQLFLSYQKPGDPRLHAKKVEPLGLYEVLLELEADPELGDLNNRKIEHRYNVFDTDGKPQPVKMELRFPEWNLDKWREWSLFLDSHDAFDGKNGASFDLKVSGFGAVKNYDLISDPNLDDAKRDEYLHDHWRNVLYVTFEITLLPGGDKITIDNVALRWFSGTFAKNQTAVADLPTIVADKSANGFIRRYRNKLLKVEEAIVAAKASLHAHRNLDEDYCHIKGVTVEDVAVCADVEVAPDADIEKVQAAIWFAIEQYFNPPVRFYSLPELLDGGVAVEEIFNGPELENGFIKSKDLQAAELKTVLRVSDIINLLMDIDGVIAVNNLLLTGYDDEGNVIRGVADPTWTNGTPVFDANKISATWLLFISELRQPRLYHNQSRFLFFKNGLPFLPRMDEAYDTLTQVRGEAERPKLKNATSDLAIPIGAFRSPDDYFPVQYSFPLTYGIGPDQLPSHASAMRRAQARQLKAYLMIFEQLLGNAFAQLAHTGDLFSLDPKVKQTYFVRQFTREMIQGYDEITNSPSQSELQAIAENAPEFRERRNRFLDHILARFGEQFREYALLLTNLNGQQVALEQLIEDKISFVKAYPQISHDRGKAFNYKRRPCSAGNVSGLKRRVSLLLGYPDLTFVWTVADLGAGQFLVTFELKDRHEEIRFEGNVTVSATNRGEAKDKAYREITLELVRPGAYKIRPEGNQFRLQLKDRNDNLLGQFRQLFQTEAQAEPVKDESLRWSSNERAIVVEHLLLRPKFPGDALYPACTDSLCATCGDEDPYSFRLTFVMPGWSAPFNDNLDMRGFADRTIRRETPAHLVGKICWVGNDEFIEDPCDPVIGKLAELLVTKGLTAGGSTPADDDACRCASAIYSAFSKVFQTWYEPRIVDYLHPDALDVALKQEFTAVDPATISCTTILDAALWLEVSELMLQRYHEVALYGWQFERFEAAWCKWLDANAAIDWTEERLQERVEAILASNVVTGPAAGKSQRDELCKCAAAIVTKYGMDFYNWMDANLKAGDAFENFTAFNFTAFDDGVVPCNGFTFKADTAAAIEALLKDRYETYKEVSYRLRIVVNLLSKLTNSYPDATLHDCDDGSDHNPVRLGQTALGSS